MALIKSISGIRGTIGGETGKGLTPVDIVKFTSAFATFLQERHKKIDITLVVGRDARVSGEMVNYLVIGSLMGMGVNVIDTGLSTTPTVEMEVILSKADGGIILTASHNPMQWNALKLLNEKGEFINDVEGKRVLDIAEKEGFSFAEVTQLGKCHLFSNSIEKHIGSILQLPLVDVEAIRKKNFKIAIDCVNSTGGIAIPRLLKALGVENIVELYCEPNGIFPHNPEPLPENLTEIAQTVVEQKCDLGIVVDPDVDRLALVCENGNMFGEEYTLVAVADYVLSSTIGNTVSNLSSSQALRDITRKHGGNYSAAAVGEVNVVEMMKKTDAIIGGEGNGGVIYPELHYGRDALVGIALFLTYLAKKDISVSSLRKTYPEYHISKNKIELTPDIDVDILLEKITKLHSDKKINTIDGVKIEFENEWVHLRKSNTEPIIRIYSESSTPEKANHLAEMIINDIKKLI
ncbi:phosphoglucosamine mutase [Bacteroidales bacterium OttesenSCG-928-C19]|nr:phosphoglucosamine mutase [Bacteroidales bacterium OttesenSCG-928-C19]